MATILETRNLTRKIGDKAIIDDFTFDFKEGKIYNILGPSGAGKSSLLRLLNRLDEPTSGEVLFHGKGQCEYKPAELRQRIGYLFQSPYLFPETVKDNLRYGDENISEERMSQLIEMVYLEKQFLDSKIDNLSGGEQQRVALARLLALNPDILLLDEPTAALDPTATEVIEKLIRELVSQGKYTVIFVTHNPEQAVRVGGEALFMAKGRLIETGSAEQIVNDPKSEQARLYKDKKLQ